MAARVTQTVIEVLERTYSKARVTQTVVEVLERTYSKARVTQTVVEVLERSTTTTTTTTTTTHLWEEDFEGMSTGVAPTGWTEDWNPSSVATTVEAVGQDKSLTLDLTSNAKIAVTIDAMGTGKPQMEALALVQAKDIFATLGGGVGVQLSGTTGSETGYVVYMDVAIGELVVRRHYNGVVATLTTQAYTLTADHWYWIRIQVNSGVVKVQIWGKQETDPGGWLINTTDASPITTPGVAGICTFNADTYCDHVVIDSMATGWPVPVPTGYITTSTTTTTSTTSTTTTEGPNVIFEDDFETGDTSKWDGYSGTITFQDDASFFGNYFVRCGNNNYIYKDITGQSEYWVSGYFTTNWGSTSTFVQFKNAGTVLVSIEWNLSTRYILAKRGTTQIDASTTQFGADDTFQCPAFVQIYCKVDNSAGRVVVIVDGETFIDFTGDTDPGSTGEINRIQVGGVGYMHGCDNFKVGRSTWPEAYTEWRPSNFSDGFESGDASAWDYSNSLTFSTPGAEGFEGSYYANGAFRSYVTKNLAPRKEYFFDWLYMAGNGNHCIPIRVKYFNWSLVTVDWSTSDVVGLYVLGVLQDSYGPVDWYTVAHRLRMRLFIDDTNGFVRVWDGENLVLSYNGDTEGYGEFTRANRFQSGDDNNYIRYSDSYYVSSAGWPNGAPTGETTTTTSTTTTSQTTTTEHGTYSTDFSEYTPDAAPDDFTEIWEVPVTVILARDTTGQYGDQSLQIDHSTFGHYYASWDDVPDAHNIDMLAKFKMDDTYPVSGHDYFKMVLREYGGNTPKNAYELRIYPNDGVARMYKMVNSVGSQIGPDKKFTGLDTGWWWARFRMWGTTIQFRVWQGQPSAEPAVWSLTRTDTTHNVKGACGVGSYNGDYTFVDYLAIGTGGNAAPAPANYVTTTTTTTTTTSTTTTGTTETPMEPPWYTAVGVLQG